jgi:cell wall-associated NlpC family hydrolase
MRRTLVAGICVALLLSIATTAPVAAATRTRSGPSAFHILGSTVLAAIGDAGARGAVDTLGNSLALLGARYRVEGSAARAEGAPQAPEPAAAATPESPPTPPPGEEELDPSAMPPASAGTNGTAVPRLSSLDTKIVAHSRGAESNAILLSGVALAPPDAPEAVQNVINAANTIVGRPYVWGGGHASFYSTGYDCSGSVSFALFGAGLIPRPLTSSELEHWGAPGPGRWITVYANGGHTFAEIAGLRWDTVGDARGTGPRWHLATTSSAGFLVRHPPGY